MTGTAGSGEAAALAHRALELEREGRLAEAEAIYQQVLARHPDLPDTWFNLAVVQRKARRFDAALASYQEALQRGVSQPEEVHLNLGVIYADCLHRHDAAAAELHAALRLNPRYVPALLNLANLEEDLGNREEALAWYERLLEIDPHCHAALARYANCRCAFGPDDAVIDRLHAALQRPGLAPADRAGLGFALGFALEKAGRFDAAFTAIEEANRQSRLGGARHDRVAQERFVDLLIEAFAADQPVLADADRAPGDGATRGPRPVFVCGMFRSGSTLVEQVLAGHPMVQAGGEIDFLPHAVATELAPFPATMRHASSEQLAQISSRYRRLLGSLHPGAGIVTDKRPDNFLYIGLIKRLFPEARIIHTRRAPLDNCLSIYFLHLDRSMPYASDLLDIGHYFKQYQRLMAHWRSLYGDDILDFDYDDFVRAPRAAAGRLLAFCGLDWDDGCLAFHERKDAVRTASVWQVRQPLYRHASGRSRNYARHLAALAAYLGVTLPGHD